MQDRYAGDVGDYGKLGLLKAVSETGLRVGINWYAVIPPRAEKNADGSFKRKDGGYPIPKKDADCDPELAEALNAIFEKRENRSVAELEELMRPYIAAFYSVPVPVKNRAAWHGEAVKALSDCDVIFMDPDNGLIPEKTKPTHAKGVKYVFDEEITAFLEAGKSVIVYQHRQRVPEERYFAELAERISRMGCSGAVPVVTFSRHTVRDYFIIPANDEHRQKLLTAVNGRSGALRLGRVRLIDTAVPRNEEQN